MSAIESFGNRLKKISEGLVLADVSDLQALCSAHTEFQQMSEEAGKESLSDWKILCDAAGDALQGIVLGDSKSPQNDFDAVMKLVSCLQHAQEGRDLRGEPIPSVFREKLGAVQPKPAPAKPEGAVKPEPPGKTEPEHTAAADPEAEFKETVISNIHAAISGDASLVSDFVSESNEHLDSCNGYLLMIEANPKDTDAINAVFRAFHTIKGVSSFLNLGVIRNLAHQAENLLDNARSGKIDLQGTAVDLVFASLDMMKQMIEDLSMVLQGNPAKCTVTGYNQLIKNLELMTSGKSDQVTTAKLPQEKALEKSRNEEEEYSIPMETVLSELPRFLDEMNEYLETSDNLMLKIEKEPTDAEAINALFRVFHTLKGSSGFLCLKSMSRLAHKAENLFAKARDGEIVLSGTASDLTFATIDALKQMGEALRKVAAESGKHGISLPEFANLEQRIENLIGKAPSLASQPSPQQQAPEEVPAAVKQEHPKHHAPAQHHVHTAAQPQTAAGIQPGAPVVKNTLKETVKVDADRLDRLVDMIGELVIAETMVVQSDELKKITAPELLQTIAQLDKITRELQAMGMSLRMVPISGTFQKMARLARDLSRKINKDIDFVMAGEDTELDKSVVDSIGDPLVHMVRNAIDHGIEASSEERVAAGKPAKGRVDLRAFHKGGSIYIEVEDDGGGLRKEKILKKAIERGIISPEADLSDREIFALILEPGFSTAEKVTEVSGRGVGMDVVKRNIEALRGQVDIQSTPGKGSIFSIRLPLTLAIIDGMVISANSEKYIIPTLSIVMSVRVKSNALKSVQNKGRMLMLQGELIPTFELMSLLHSENEACSEEREVLIVIVEADGLKTGLVIDEILGQQQIVIKSLGSYLKGLPGISGGAIMPDGTVGLILDVGGLVKLANSN